MECAFGAADLVVCRSGATTLAELTRVGKPAILIPYPHAAADHQTHNARSLVDAGAAKLIADGDASAKLGSLTLELLNDPDQLEAIGAASSRLGKPEAGQAIAATILEMIH
jgi:UDP-N-acetylglucosamine--N-acetylmuramyl-(pentapeptide) pyrophosphoryl-undecaprenol N-acetylglucosamine transferase